MIVSNSFKDCTNNAFLIFILVSLSFILAFSHIETDLLAKGINFSINSKTLPNKDIATIEDAEKDLEKEEANTIHAKVNLNFKTPHFLRITCPRKNIKLRKN